MILSSKNYFYKIRYKDASNFRNMYYWLDKTCRGRFYTSPAWAGNFVEFEDEQDAVLFSLTWP